MVTLKVVSESRDVGYLCANFSLLSVLELGPMYVTDVRQKHRLMPPPIRGGA